MNRSPIPVWHQAVEEYNPKVLDKILDTNCTFYSPILFKPQQGKRLVKMYLLSAFEMFKEAGNFRYVKEIEQGNTSVLEFIATIEGIEIDGIDMITWNEDGLITAFKVMIRPLKAIDMIKNKMAEKLSQLSAVDKLKIRGGLILDKLKLKV